MREELIFHQMNSSQTHKLLQQTGSILSCCLSYYVLYTRSAFKTRACLLSLRLVSKNLLRRIVNGIQTLFHSNYLTIGVTQWFMSHTQTHTHTLVCAHMAMYEKTKINITFLYVESIQTAIFRLQYAEYSIPFSRTA